MSDYTKNLKLVASKLTGPPDENMNVRPYSGWPLLFLIASSAGTCQNRSPGFYLVIKNYGILFPFTECRTVPYLLKLLGYLNVCLKTMALYL
jgi:hypothetical protein